MGANRVGQLYFHTRSSIRLWSEPGLPEGMPTADTIGTIKRAEAFLVVAKAGWPDQNWLQVLVGGMLGWIYAGDLNLVWVDPEEAP